MLQVLVMFDDGVLGSLMGLVSTTAGHVQHQQNENPQEESGAHFVVRYDQTLPPPDDDEHTVGLLLLLRLVIIG